MLPRPAPRPARQWPAAVALIAMTLLAYWPALSAGYVWDDDDHVTQTPIQRTPTALKWVWTRLGTTPQYYPLTHTTFWLEYQLWGTNPAGYHADNVLLQAANALLLWRVLVGLEIPAAWLAAAIFAIHPVQVESVAWITERKNLLSTFFYLLAMRWGLRAWRLVPGAPGGAIPWTSYLLCLLAFLLALFSKTVTCTFPAALAVVLWWKKGTISRRDWAMLLPMFLCSLVFARVTGGMEVWNVGATGPEFAFSPAERLLIAGRAVWFYAMKLLWPVNLAFIYPRWNVSAGAIWQWIFPLAAVAVVVGLWLVRRRIGRGPLAAVGLFVGALFPALGFINVYPMRFSFVADHFQYLASIALIVLLANLLWRSVPATRRRQALAGCLLATLGALTWRQTLIYKDAATLWRDTLGKNPRCWLAMDNLGADAARRGDESAALGWYARSLETYPAQREARLNRARILEAHGQWDAAAADIAAAAALRPDDRARTDHEMALLLAARGDLPAAAAEYETLLAERPDMELARLEYGRLLENNLHRPRDAEAQYLKAIELNPDSLGARTALGSFYYSRGENEKALQWMAEATDLNPRDAILRNNYGSMLMQAGRVADAEKQFRQAVEIDPVFAEAWFGLGCVAESEGRLGEARGLFAKALELKPNFHPARQKLGVAGPLGFETGPRPINACG